LPADVLTRQKFCGPACRKAAHMAKFQDVQLDGEGEIPVADLETSPRRLALARLLDRYEGGEIFGGAFDHYTMTSPRFANPADRRASK
jgi:hypothetical protein